MRVKYRIYLSGILNCSVAFFGKPFLSLYEFHLVLALLPLLVLPIF